MYSEGDRVIIGQSSIQAIFPSFVLQKQWQTPDGFNDRLFELAKMDAESNRITSASNGANVGDLSNHIGHLRHNFLDDFGQYSEVRTLAEMAHSAILEYLQAAYGYDHKRDINMMSDTFWQRGGAYNEQTGVNTHTHITSDLVVTYYPKVELDDGCPDSSLHRGQVRFYDPSGKGKRLWPCSDQMGYVGGWYSVQPVEGLMTVFEGHIPHDSTMFIGGDRMCIPIMCDLDLPNSHVKKPLSALLNKQS